MQFRDKTARVVSLVLTHGCNLHCTYCFELHKNANEKMSVSIAKEIIERELAQFHPTKEDDTIVFEYFGGEPLMRFDLIEEVSEFFWKTKQNKKYRFKVTTNGTLLDERKQAWFALHKDKISITLSIDGIEDEQIRNRGRAVSQDVLDFVQNTWSDSHFKSTMSRETLPNFADNIIRMTECGYRVAATIGVGIPWSDNDALIYKRELTKLAEYYLQHPDCYMIPLFRSIYAGILSVEDNASMVPPPNCGIMRNMVTYDVDGEAYPCHMFLPFVNGKTDYKKIAEIDFSNADILVSDDCKQCNLLPVCRTCYGFNYNHRGDVSLRDKSFCAMLLAEVQVISAFQINYLVRKSENQCLTDEELLTLKVATLCYQRYSDFSFK